MERVLNLCSANVVDANDYCNAKTVSSFALPLTISITLGFTSALQVQLHLCLILFVSGCVCVGACVCVYCVLVEQRCKYWAIVVFKIQCKLGQRD